MTSIKDKRGERESGWGVSMNHTRNLNTGRAEASPAGEFSEKENSQGSETAASAPGTKTINA